MLARILSTEFGDKVVDVLSRYSQVVSQAVSFIRWCEREPGKIQSYGADVVGEFSDLEDAGGSGRNYLATWTRRGPVGAVPGRLPPTVVPHGCDAAVPVSERAGGGGRPSEAMAVPPQHADAHTALAAHALPAPALGQHAEEFVKGEPAGGPGAAGGRPALRRGSWAAGAATSRWAAGWAWAGGAATSR